VPLVRSQQLTPDVSGHGLGRRFSPGQSGTGAARDLAGSNGSQARHALAVLLAGRRWHVALVGAGCAALTLAFALVPALRFGYRDPAAHGSLETATALVALLVAVLAVARLKRQPKLPPLLLACGLGALATASTALDVIPWLLHDGSRDVAWAAAAGRLGGTLLICAAVVAPPVRVERRLRLATATFSALVFLVPLSIVWLLRSQLPAVATDQLARAAGSLELHVYSAYPILQLVLAVLYALAAVGLARRSSRREEFIRWLAIACTFAAFAHLNYFLYPSLYSDGIYLGDAFRLLFFALLLIAVFREAIGFWRSAAETAAANERWRLARDLHDGLAQEIAFIRSALPSVTQMDDHELPRRLSAAAERAERESRQLLATLVEPSAEEFETRLTNALREVGLREQVVVEIVGGSGVRLGAIRAEALVRIASEAVTNAARHAGVSEVTVTFGRRGDRVRLAIKDEGSGFDPSEVSRVTTDGRGLGLASMRARAAAVGGQLTISSRRNAGTEVVVTV
jgi:signal transduction histidine kinase